MIFSADIEDWQQSVLDFERPVSSRVVRNTGRLLDLLDECAVQGTFFVQGMVAEAFPALVKAIAARGHELASHAYSHRPLYTLSAAQFRAELDRSIPLLEDLGGQKVIGFRAPSFSVQDALLDGYCDALLAHGLRYDSSLMPSSIRKLYGRVTPAGMDKMRASGLDLYPLSVSQVCGRPVPVLGGGYFRIFPYRLTRWLARDLDPDACVFYMHPYELDTREYREVGQPAGISRRWALHQFAGRSGTARKLRRLCGDYSLTSFRRRYYAAA